MDVFLWMDVLFLDGCLLDGRFSDTWLGRTMLFMKMDSNSDRSISWSEFARYLLQFAHTGGGGEKSDTVRLLARSYMGVRA